MKIVRVTVHSVHSNFAKIHSRLPAAMEFCLVCLGILAHTNQISQSDIRNPLPLRGSTPNN